MSSDLSQYLHDKRALVDARLQESIRAGDGCPESLAEAMCYSLLAPGKRLRPLLVILAAEACGGGDAAALPAACAVEMVHTYSLIHDDLPAMDDDDLRRGLPTCHKKFSEAMAILAGDALLTLAFEVLAEGYPPATAAACCRQLARGAGAAGMVGGQVDDLAMESRQGTSALSELEFLHARKTGALFRASLRLGVLSAQGERPSGADPRALAMFDAYGQAFGLAFQITDDLLDVESSAEQTGKRVGKDAARGKLTYPGFLGTAESRRRAQRLCREAQDALAPLGSAGERLAALARSIVERDR
ncbi:MAG TPA: farnesyl diphosphate synthase [Gemmataceae bacterium]|nr:farnesyl diphosphate synthase [Gemmataceae bacterium]